MSESFDHCTKRFLCPIEACRRVFKSKTAWTRHLRLVHPTNLNPHHQNIIVDLPVTDFLPTLDNHSELASLPASPAGPHDSDFAYDNFDDPSASNEYDLPSGDLPHSGPLLASSHEDSVETNYHPIINGDVYSFFEVVFLADSP